MSASANLLLLIESDLKTRRFIRAGFDAAFGFVPHELVGKCWDLVQGFHAMHRDAVLPDMLWHSDARDLIQANPVLMLTFKRASKRRFGKRANESLQLVATIVVCLEILARDFAGWGMRFPSARRRAEELLFEYPMRSRSWFMDQYLFPSLCIHREFVQKLVPDKPAPNPSPEKAALCGYRQKHQHSEWGTESGNTSTRHLGQSLIVDVANNAK